MINYLKIFINLELSSNVEMFHKTFYLNYTTLINQINDTEITNDLKIKNIITDFLKKYNESGKLDNDCLSKIIDLLIIISWFLMTSAVSSYLSMNFTGATTFTSLSGVNKEIRIAIPLQIGGFIIGMIIYIIMRFI